MKSSSQQHIGYYFIYYTCTLWSKERGQLILKHGMVSWHNWKCVRLLQIWHNTLSQDLFLTQEWVDEEDEGSMTFVPRIQMNIQTVPTQSPPRIKTYTCMYILIYMYILLTISARSKNNKIYISNIAHLRTIPKGN
jgi:hypothetical protein